MCRLCGDEKERKEEMGELGKLSDDLHWLSARINSVCHGVLKPHSDDMKGIGSTAKSIIRQLVERYL